jgi:hypothetical protein
MGWVFRIRCRIALPRWVVWPDKLWCELISLSQFQPWVNSTMSKMCLSLTIVAASIVLTGCLTAPVMPPPGFVYTSYKAPLDYDSQQSPIGSRVGTAETKSILGLVAWGDGSYRTAAENGKINTVHGADYEYFNVLGVYQKYTTILHGE